MRQLTQWILTLGLVGAAWLASAQERPTPAPAPRPADPAPAADAPAVEPVPATPSAEVHELQIIEVPSTQDAPAPPNAVDAPGPRREVRIVDGDTTIWVDEGGEVHALGDAMGLALEFNPEIRAIRAEIQALMARLEQLEMKTATDVVRKKGELKLLMDKQTKLKSQFVPSSPEVRMLDADIAAKKVELDYILGQPGHTRGDRPFESRARVIRGDIPLLETIGMRTSRPELASIENTQIKEMFDRPLLLEYEKTPLHEVVGIISEVYEVNVNLDVSVRDMPIDVNLKNVTVRQALAALADANPDLVFIIREYGIFVTTRGRAITIPGPSIPEGVPYSPHAAAIPALAPADFGFAVERVFKDGVVELRKVDKQQSDKALDYVEGSDTPKPKPAPTPKPNN